MLSYINGRNKYTKNKYWSVAYLTRSVLFVSSAFWPLAKSGLFISVICVIAVFETTIIYYLHIIEVDSEPLRLSNIDNLITTTQTHSLTGAAEL